MAKNPRGKKLTPQQEKQLEHSEYLLARTQILISGVAETLKEGRYIGQGELAASHAALSEAAAVRKEADAIRAKLAPEGFRRLRRRRRFRRV